MWTRCQGTPHWSAGLGVWMWDHLVASYKVCERSRDVLRPLSPAAETVADQLDDWAEEPGNHDTSSHWTVWTVPDWPAQPREHCQEDLWPRDCWKQHWLRGQHMIELPSPRQCSWRPPSQGLLLDMVHHWLILHKETVSFPLLQQAPGTCSWPPAAVHEQDPRGWSRVTWGTMFCED